MDEEALQWTRGEVWARAFPDAPPGELERFRVANIDKPLEAKRIYDWYRGWRRAEGSAARVAASAARVPNFHFVTVGGRTPLGDKILLVEGARFDPSVDPAAYVALICLRIYHTQALDHLDSSIAEDQRAHGDDEHAPPLQSSA